MKLTDLSCYLFNRAAMMEQVADATGQPVTVLRAALTVSFEAGRILRVAHAHYPDCAGHWIASLRSPLISGASITSGQPTQPMV